MEINNISPIGQKVSVSPMNVKSKKVVAKDPEEEQLEREIETINVSYMNTRFSSLTKEKENRPQNIATMKD